MTEERRKELLELATGLHGGQVKLAESWLGKPLKPLGGRSAIEVSETPDGFEQVKRLISQLEHGVYV